MNYPDLVPHDLLLTPGPEPLGALSEPAAELLIDIAASEED